jgi:LPS export ABC transporter permease LptF/LPS export ABC transporter permease LptG
MRFSLTISRYLISSIFPYFIFSWLLLSVVLFVQQASRFADIFFSANIPTNLVWQLTVALVPNVIAFTCPMAVLVGVIIGLSKMQGDSELVAIRAAGVGNIQITIPILFVGILLSIFAFFINLYGVPLAASIVRRVAMQTAIYKLESPIEPGVFNTEIAGYTIYVRDGDLYDGEWKNIFVHSEDPKAGTVRLLTSSKGRIDSSGEDSELVLEDATAITINKADRSSTFVSESIGQVRVAIKTRRGELVQRLGNAELTPEELGLSQLSRYAGEKEGKERTEAEILWQRRIILSLTPLVFCLLGTSLVLRFNRKGRGFGIFIALVSLIAYYLLAFLGEQMARTGRVSVLQGGLIPIILCLLAVVWFNFTAKVDLFGRIASTVREWVGGLNLGVFRMRRTSPLVDVTTGIRDFDIIVSVGKYYLLTLGFLASIFVIFTAFELWRFAGTMDGGVVLLLKYLFYLLPFVYIQLAPSAAMIAILATYVIKSRQNELVIWTSAGQSIYRLFMPALALMLFLGGINFLVQEYLAPGANQMQDELRLQIRSGGKPENKNRKFWVANEDRIYSFEIPRPSNNTLASDNATHLAGDSRPGQDVSSLTVYEFSDNTKLQAVYHAESARWDVDRIRFLSGGRKTSVGSGGPGQATAFDGELDEKMNPFAEARKKPSHLTTAETRAQLESSEADVEKRSFGVALHKKYSVAFLPLIIALFTAPFALNLSRRGKAALIGYAVGLWLVFIGLTSTFEQLGLNGKVSPALAVWIPLAFFTLLGVYLLSRLKT